ncbi:MAG: hypothetical protein Q8Q38_03105 [bacterium]|nr:hypothetical protein [bacterium]MDZ4232055.1 hypothetical protein [Candidatus Pacearchaeota archaeon]
MEGKNVCGCSHHKVIPVLIVLFGALFFLGEIDVVSSGTVSLWWPIIVMAGGLTKLTAKACKCC